MKGCIIYFSGTGITEGYARIIANELKQKGEMASFHNITSNKDREAGIDFGFV
ncbi:MAG: hypothetical protein ACW99Q_15410 [Candidatus Kariarchaeaceae archaeon]